MKAKPRILLATTCRWLSAARLAMSLSDCGCEIEAVCPSGHPLIGIRAIGRTHPYRYFRPLESFRAALELATPDLVIPCDELAVNTLYRLYDDALRHQRNSTCLLLKRSLGDPSSYGLLSRRPDILALAQDEGVMIPETAEVRTVEELLQWLARHGYPAVLKADGTAGGRGVRVVCTQEEARSAFRSLHAPPLAARAVKRAVVDHDLTLILPWIARERPPVSVQLFVPGRECTSTFACWEGNVLANLTFDVVRTWKRGGPASVLELAENPAILAAATKLAKRLNLSGFYGLDFIIEEGTDRACMIEVNPRATQTCHLPFGPGRDLPAALAAAVAGELVAERTDVIVNRQIALFPLEMQRNPASHFLKSAYHDVPWAEPGLVTLGLREFGKSSPLRSYEAWSEFWSRRGLRVSAGAVHGKERPPTQ